MRSRTPLLLLLLLVAFGIAACGGGNNQPDSVTWRNVTLQLPDGWYLFEQEDTRLSISNQDIGLPSGDEEQRERPEGDVVAMFFTYEPNTVPDDWRRFVEQQDAKLESDEQIVLDGEIPATRLVFSHVTNDIPTREMVVVVPSRGIVLLAQPVPEPMDTDAPQIFLDYIETFLEVVETAEFGSPVTD